MDTKEIKQIKKETEKRLEEVEKKEVQLDKKEEKLDKKIEAIEKKEEKLDEKIANISKIEKLKNTTKDSAKRFKDELTKSMNTAIVAAFGFLIALSWRELITAGVQKIESVSPLNGKIFEALIITIVGAIGITITTTILSKKEAK